MRRLLLGAVLAASLGGFGAGTADAVCDPQYRPLCMSDCPGPLLPDPRNPTDFSWLVRMCPDGAATTASTECETAARCVGYCANQRFDAARAASWTVQFVNCVS